MPPGASKMQENILAAGAPRWGSLQRSNRPLAAPPQKTSAPISAFHTSGFGPSDLAADSPVNFEQLSPF